MASKEKIFALVGMLCETFGRKPTKATYTGYHIGLGDLSDAQIDLAGTVALRQNRQFMPPPGELREIALTGGESLASMAESAWREFDAAVGRYGGDYSVSFADGIINAVIRHLGGWVWCCSRGGDDYHVWLRRSFVEAYSRFVREGGASEELRGPHFGRIWQNNAGISREVFRFPRANYTGDVVTIGTNRNVLQGPSDAHRLLAGPGHKPIKGSGPGGTKLIGQVIDRLKDDLADAAGEETPEDGEQ